MKIIKSMNDFNKMYFPKQYEKDCYDELSQEDKIKHDVDKYIEEVETIE